MFGILILLLVTTAVLGVGFGLLRQRPNGRGPGDVTGAVAGGVAELMDRFGFVSSRWPINHDVLSLQRRLVRVVARSALYVSITGERRALNHVVVAVSPADHSLLRSLPQPLEAVLADIATMAKRRLDGQKAVSSGPLSVTLAVDSAVIDGNPQPGPRQGATSSTSEQKTRRWPLTGPLEAGAGPTERLEEPMVLLGDERGGVRVMTGPVTAIATPTRTVLQPKGRRSTEPMMSPSPRAVLHSLGPDSRSFDIAPSELPTTIGRSGDIRPEHPEVSAHHAQLVLGPEGWLLTDAASRNGTFVNDKTITSATLRSGDIVRFSSFGPEYRFEAVEAQGAPG